MPVDSAEGGEKQTELLNRRGVVVDHDQVSDVKYFCGEIEDKLRGLILLLHAYAI